MINLMVYQSGTYRVHELVGDVTMIGRTPSSHIVIGNPVVSAEHAIVLKVGDSYRLRDLNSTNGTQINGIVVTDADLKDGDEIRFGSVKAVFCRTLSQSVVKAVPWNAADVAAIGARDRRNTKEFGDCERPGFKRD